MTNTKPTPRRQPVLNSDVRKATLVVKKNVYVIDLESFAFKISVKSHPGWRKYV